MWHTELLCLRSHLHSGLLGQSFDRSYCPHVVGKLDNYSQLDNGRSALERRSVGGDITTHAMGEGAIEGTADDYLVCSNVNGGCHTWLPFSTDFKYGRFDARAAPPRNLSKLASGGKCAPAQTRWNLTHVMGGGLWPGLNFAGYDFKTQPMWLSKPKQCKRACEKRAGCVAFSFILSTGSVHPARRCWLKRRGFERSAFLSQHVISGVLPKDAAKRSRIREQQQASSRSSKIGQIWSSSRGSRANM